MRKRTFSFSWLIFSPVFLISRTVYTWLNGCVYKNCKLRNAWKYNRRGNIHPRSGRFLILQIGGWPPFAVWSQQLSAQGWCLFAGGCRDKTSFTHLIQITIRSYRYQWGRNYSILFTCHSNHAYKRKLKKNVFKLSQKLSYPLGIKYEVKICLLILSIYLCFRHYLYEKKIARLRWKLEYKDLMFVDNVEEIISPTKRKVNASLKPICKNFSNSCLFYIREIFHEPLKFLPGRSCPSILYILSQGYRRSADGWSDKILL